MTYLTLVLAIGLGYVIGLLQNGIKVYQNYQPEYEDGQYNESHGISEIKEYYDETEGMNKF